MVTVPGGRRHLGPVPVGATRRTTTLLVTPRGSWRDGQTVTAVGRDLVRGAGGEARASHARFAFDIDPAGRIVPLSDRPSVPEQLRGLPSQRGLRKAMARLREEHGDELLGPVGGLREALLDDVVGTSLASGYGRLYEGSAGGSGSDVSSVLRLTCVGFSTMHRRGEEFDVQRYFETKPPSVEFVPDDPLAWHEDPPMPNSSFRRRRLLQVEPDGDTVAITGYFRDTFMRPDGVEMVVHEYGLNARASGDPLVLDAVEAVPGDLPLEHCPLAAPSALRLEGLPLAEVEGVVRREVAGPTACTHLNDELRSLRMVRALLGPVSPAS